MLNLKKIKKYFLICIALLVKQTYGMVATIDNRDSFSNLPKETFFLIIDLGLSSIIKEPRSKIITINYIHKTNGNEHRYEKIIKYIQSINLTSKKFLELTNTYRIQNLKYFIKEKDLFSLAIDTNNTKPIDGHFLPIQKNYTKQTAMFKWLQWEIFYNTIVTNLRAYQNYKKNKKNFYLTKASKNCLKYCLIIMQNKIVYDFLSNYIPHINKRILSIYKSKVLKNIQEPYTWLDAYIESNFTHKPRIPAYNNFLDLNYTPDEENKLKIFIKKNKNFCLENEKNILNLLKNNLTCRQKIYLIMRFLIVFNSIEKKELIENFLTVLSNAYWYNTSLFF